MGDSNVGLFYKPYSAVVCHLDQSLSLRLTPTTHGAKSRAPLSRILRSTIDFHRKCNDIHRSENATRSEPSESAPKAHLLNPLCLVAFGRSDDVGIALIDNLQSVFRITAGTPGLENASIALCPSIESFGIACNTCVGRWPPIYELHELLGDRWDFTTGDRSDNRPSAIECCDLISRHPVFHTAPLCAISRVKINSLLSLEHAALSHRATIQLVVDTIGKVCNRLRELNPLHADQLGIRSSDVDSLRCVILESLGSDDIIILSFCSNYSIPFTVLRELRGVTLQDLFDTTAGDELRTYLSSPPTSLHNRLSDLAARWLKVPISTEHPGPDADRLKPLGSNHIFASSYTTLTASHKAVFNPEQPPISRISGRVIAQIRIDSSPGHETAVATLAENSLRENCDGPRKDVDDGESPQSNSANVSSDIAWVLPGRHDSLLNFGPNGVVAPYNRSEAMPTSTVLKTIGSVIADAKAPAGNSNSRWRETGILNISTDLIVPVYLRHSPNRSQEILHPPGMAILEIMSKALERRFLQHDTIRRLHERKTTLGLPESFFTICDFLFNDFIQAFSDPAFMDSILDLYECYSSLLLLLDECQAAIRVVGPFDARAVHLRRRLRSAPLDNYLSALENAFAHRMARSLVNHDTLDSSFDFCGSINKLLAASDVLLKNALGMVRHLQWPGADAEAQRVYKQRVSGVTQVGFGSRTTVRWLTYMWKPHGSSASSYAAPCHLAIVGMNILNVFRPSHWLRYFHEIIHMHINPQIQNLCASMCATNRSDDVEKQDCEGGDHIPYILQSWSELAVEIATQLLVFGGDPDLFAKQYMMAYGEAEQDIDATMRRAYEYRDLMLKLSEVMWNGFLVWSVASRGREFYAAFDAVRWKSDDAANLVAGLGSREEVVDSAMSYVNQYGSMCAAHWRLRQGVDEAQIDEYLRLEFARRWDSEHKGICTAVKVALHVVESYFGRVAQGNPSKMAIAIAEEEKCIEGCIERGEMYRRRLYRMNVDDLDELIISSALLRAYVRRILSDVSAQSQHQLDEEAGVIRPAPERTYVIDLLTGEMRHLCSKKRQEILLAEAIVVKSLWDISSSQRARRFCDIMSDEYCENQWKRLEWNVQGAEN